MKQPNTPQILLGPDSLHQLPKLLEGHRVLLVHGHRPVEDGLLEQVRILLTENGIAHENMGQILPDPKYKSVKRGIRQARKTNCDYILSLGGGSTLQCARGIALGVPYKGDVWDFWAGKKKPGKALPVAAVLTNPATGNELSDKCTLVKKGKRKTFQSSALTCRFAILDPKLSVLPWYPTMNQGFTLFAHVFTSALSVPEERLAEYVDVLNRILESIQSLSENIDSIEARDSLFEAGVLSHKLRKPDPTGLMELSSELAFQYSLPRGTAISALFSAWWQGNYSRYTERMEQLGQKLFHCAPGRALENINVLLGHMKLADSLPAAGLQLSDKEVKSLTSDKNLRQILTVSSRSK